LERVATIGSHLPEDDAPQSPTNTHSPAILSQACSSIELAPIGSHTSLHCITEDALAETEEDEMTLDSPAMELSVYRIDPYTLPRGSTDSTEDQATRDDRRSHGPAAASTGNINIGNGQGGQNAINDHNAATGGEINVDASDAITLVDGPANVAFTDGADARPPSTYLTNKPMTDFAAIRERAAWAAAQQAQNPRPPRVRQHRAQVPDVETARPAQVQAPQGSWVVRAWRWVKDAAT
jgi:hypothetical protein